MARLVKVNNPFNHLDKTTKEISSGVPIHFYLHEDRSDIEFVASINGTITEDYEYILQENDCLGFVAIPKGGGGDGKNVLRTVAFLALAISAPALAGALAGNLIGSGAAFVLNNAAFVTAGITIAGGVLINSVIPIQTPSLNTSTDLSTVSPTYAFTGGSNAREVGTTLPLMLGTARVTPPIIGSYLSLENDKQYLNILMAVNSGLVESIDQIEINNQPIANFNDIIPQSTIGSNDQIALGNFRDSSTTFSLQRNLNELNIDTTYTTFGNSVNELEIVMSLPKGLFEITDSGDYNDYILSFKLEYRIIGASTWNTIQGSSSDYDYTYNQFSVTWELDGEENVATKTFVGTQTFDNDRGQSFNEIGFLYEFKERILKTTSSDTITLITAFKTAKRLAYRVKNLKAEQYEVRVTRLSEYSTNTRIANDLTLDYINEVVYDDFSYPNVALLSINALATDQLNGAFPTVSCVCKSVGENRPNNNPAWACYTILKNNGISDNKIDLDKFEDWANYCDERTFKCNLYLDNQMNMEDALSLVSSLGRGKVLQFGSIFSPIIDRAVIVENQSFLFTSGNTKDFLIDYIPYDDRTNVVEVTYYDETDGYKAKNVQVQAFNFDSTDIEIKSSINYYGCTLRQQALEYAQALINNNRYISQTVSFTAGVDAIASTVGDVIRVGRKFMSNSIGDGRIVTATATTITLDQEVILEADIDYEVQARLADNRIIFYDVPAVSVETITDTVTITEITELDEIPEKFDIFAFGRQDTEATDLFRIVAISKQSDFTRKIEAIEYNPDVYNDDKIINVEPVIPLNTTVNNLQISENIIKNKDKSISEILTLDWVGASGLSTSIYVDDELFGTTDQNFFEIRDLLTANQTYVFRVGEKELTHTFLGLFAPPEPPTNLKVTQSKDIIRLNWKKSTSIDSIAYEIRTGVTWETGFKIGEVGDVNTFEWYPDMNNNYRFWVKTIDTSGVYSKDAINIQYNVTNIDEGLNVIIDEDLLDTVTPPCGDTSGLVFVVGVGFIPFETATWEQIQASTWDELSELQWGGDASFVSCPIDTTKIGLTKIRILSAFDSQLINPTWLKISNRSWLDIQFDTWDDISSTDFDFIVSYSISDDDAIYSDFKQYTGIVDETFRYIKFKYELIGNLGGQNVEISDFRVILDVPDIEFSVLDRTIVSNETITFTSLGYDFYTAPRIIPTSKDNLNIAVISDIDNTEFDIDSFDSSGTLSTGTFDLTIRGY